LGERTRLNFGLTNFLDRSFRMHGSGIDSGGVNGFLCLRYTF
jgi:hypothetical protein